MLVQKMEIETKMTQADQGARSSSWRGVWPLGVSVLLHAVVFGAYLVSWVPSPPPAALPQIELLPPAPVPPMPEEAAPSPVEAPPKPMPTFLKIASQPIPQQPLRPIVTTNDHAERAITKPPDRKPPQPPAPQAPVEETRGAAVDAATPPTSGAKNATNAVPGDPSPSTRPAGPPPDYLGLIRAQLDKVKRYPGNARAAGYEGTVMLAFVLDRSGHVSSWKISRASGIQTLDDEVETMIQRAAFPPFPTSLDQDDLHLVVPVEFSLKDWEHR